MELLTLLGLLGTGPLPRHGSPSFMLSSTIQTAASRPVAPSALLNTGTTMTVFSAPEARFQMAQGNNHHIISRIRSRKAANGKPLPRRYKSRKPREVVPQSFPGFFEPLLARCWDITRHGRLLHASEKIAPDEFLICWKIMIHELHFLVMQIPLFCLSRAS